MKLSYQFAQALPKGLMVIPLKVGFFPRTSCSTFDILVSFILVRYPDRIGLVNTVRYHRLYRSIRIIGPLCDSPLIPRDLWIPVSTRTRYAWSRLAGFSNELCTRVYRNYGDLRRLSCTTTAPTIHRTSPLNCFAIRGPRRSLYSRTTSVIFVTRSQCTDHCLRTTPMLTIASSLPMS